MDRFDPPDDLQNATRQELIDEIAKLSRRNRLLSDITDNMFDLVSMADLDGKVIWISESHRMLGHDMDSLVGTHVLNFVHPDERAAIVEALTEVGSSAVQKTVEHRLRKADGTYIWLESKGKLLFGSDGRPSGLIFGSRDISERRQIEDELRRSASALVEAQKIAGVGSWAYEIATEASTWSRQMFTIFGFDPEGPAPTKQERRTVLHPDDWHRVDRAVNLARTEGVPYSERFRIIGRDGQIKWVQGIGRAERDADGRIAFLSGTVQDITEVVRSEKQLEQAIFDANRRAEEMKLLLDGAEQVLHEGDFAATARSIFDAVRKMTGAVAGYVALQNQDGTGYEVLFHEGGDLQYSADSSLRMLISGVLAEVIESGRCVCRNDFMSFSPASLLPPGHPVVRNVLLAPLNVDGRTVGVIGLANKPGDFSEEDIRISEAFAQLAAVALKNSRLRRELVEQKNFFEQMFVQSSISTEILDRDGWCQRINRKLSEIFGVEPSAMEGRVYNIFNDEGIRQGGVVPHLKKVFEEGKTAEWEVNFDIGVAAESQNIKVRNKKTVWFSNWAYPIFDDAGRLSHAIIQHTDISERKNSENERARLQDQLQQAMKMEAVGRLAGGVAHDFNNLLTGIIGHVSLALMQVSPDDELKENLVEIRKAAESATALTRQLLAFSRKQIIEPRVLDLNEIIASLRQMMARLIGEDITLNTVAGADLGAVRIDPGQFEQILVNLVVNGRDAMPEGGELTIRTSNVELDADYCRVHPYVKTGRYVELTVTDTGHGMSDEVKEHLFEPFFTTKPKGRGTGFGLATIYGAVKQAGGFIEVISEEGKGTTVQIFLRRVDSVPERLREDSGLHQIRVGTETVLFVEDEDIVREIVERILNMHGYNVLAAGDAEQAIVLASEFKERIDLLMTDVVMPGMNGRQLAERLTKIHPEMKVLYSSGYSENEIAHHGIVDEGINYIGKPFTPDSLAKKLREVLSPDG